MAHQIYPLVYFVFFQEKIFNHKMVIPAREKQKKGWDFCLSIGYIELEKVTSFGIWSVCWVSFLFVEKCALSPSWKLICWEASIWNQDNGGSEFLLCWLKLWRKARNEHQFMKQFHLTSLLEYFVNWAQFPSALNMFYDMDIFPFPWHKIVLSYTKLIA